MVKIPNRARHCTAGQEPFEPGSKYTSTLDWQEGEWVRADYCDKCLHKKEDTAHTWQGQIPKKQEKKAEPDEQAYSRFCTMYESKKQPELLYLLALYLERKKMLTRRGLSFFEEVSSGKMFDIKPLKVDESAKQELLELFHA